MQIHPAAQDTTTASSIKPFSVLSVSSVVNFFVGIS
jgi:hypothetical protein